MVTNNSKYSTDELAIGIVFKYLRESKGLSQKEAAGAEISVSHLSNFENGHVIIATHHFISLLNNIAVDMFEFQNAYNQYLGSKDNLLFNVRISNAVMEGNTVQLELLSKQVEQSLLDNPDNKKLKLDNIRMKSVLYFVDSSYFITKQELNFLIDYLFNLKEWGLYDIRLLGQCAQFIDVIKLIDLTNRMTAPMQINKELHQIQLATVQCVLNIINVFVDQKIFEPARRLIKYLEDSEIHEYFMFEKLTLIYNRANYSYQKGDEQASEVMVKCLEILKFCDCAKTATQVSKELHDLGIEFPK
ncbi:helix-turn-helix domain-containing protein [Lactovum miscens]|uniref:Rgg/GadR/MutR family transcriptional activator n=1 Tax=Lactovum miscens TaxID=190387 RepID=A0A841C742_9LACT|nr:Rgg/GadR/MutR family transcriptional regulator [Lactovum miscens]MBB5888295.1 Rgg/GadR/MutR family transcriptional activator [Lactovum miscens]